jgi:hypothetical protein
MQACKNPEEAYAVAKETGVTDSFDDFVAEMTKIYESVKDLSEDDLHMVAGGGGAPPGTETKDIVIVTNTVIASAIVSFSALLIVPALATSV